MIVSTGEQPFGVVESSLRHPQFGQRGANLPLDTGAGMRGSAGGQAQCHFGFVPAADVAEDEAEVGPAVGVEERRAIVDARAEMPVSCADPLVGAT